MTDKLSPEELRAKIEAAIDPYELEKQTGDYGGDGYDNAARYAAKVLLRVASRDPRGFKAALDAFRKNPYGQEMDALMTSEEKAVVMDGHLGITGFQWGWAVNAAAYCTEQPPVPNPAIVTIGAKD